MRAQHQAKSIPSPIRSQSRLSSPSQMRDRRDKISAPYTPISQNAGSLFPRAFLPRSSQQAPRRLPLSANPTLPHPRNHRSIHTLPAHLLHHLTSRFILASPKGLPWTLSSQEDQLERPRHVVRAIDIHHHFSSVCDLG